MARAWRAVRSIWVVAVVSLLAGCTADFDRFKPGVVDSNSVFATERDGGVPFKPGDGDGDFPSGDGDDGFPIGDGDMNVLPGDGDGAMSDAQMPPAPECEVDDDCPEGFVCLSDECVFVPPERAPSAVVQTVGGGLLTGGNHVIQLRVGAPPIAGQMEGGGHRLILGPFAGVK